MLSREVKLAYRTLKERQSEYNKKEAQMYGNMFARLSKPESGETKVRPFGVLCFSIMKDSHVYFSTGLQKAESESTEIAAS